MLFRLAFKKTEDDYLQVTAFAKGLQNMSAIHRNSHVFSIAVKVAEIPGPLSSELDTAANQAYLGTGTDVCCELIELTRPQLEALRLLPPEDKIA